MDTNGTPATNAPDRRGTPAIVGGRQALVPGATDEPHSAPQDRAARVIAVIPAYNEERFIASVVMNARGHAHEVIVVSDGSDDRTADLAEMAGAVVIRQPANRGKAEALNAGFRHATSLGADVVVCLDGDAQHDPSEIRDLVAPIVAGEADVVVGSRFLGKRSKIPQWRQFGQHTLTAVTNVTSGLKITDSQSGYRAFSAQAMQVLHFHSSGLSVESEMQFKVRQAGLRLVEVPISVSYLDGNKRNPIIHGLQVLDAVLSLVARRRPLLFFTFPGTLAVFAGLFLGVHVALRLQATEQLLVGSAILTALLVIVGLLLAMSGIMLHSVQHLVKRFEESLKEFFPSASGAGR